MLITRKRLQFCLCWKRKSDFYINLEEYTTIIKVRSLLKIGKIRMIHIFDFDEENSKKKKKTFNYILNLQNSNHHEKDSGIWYCIVFAPSFWDSDHEDDGIFDAFWYFLSFHSHYSPKQKFSAIIFFEMKLKSRRQNAS